jgi:hypothetical protein
MVAHVLLPLAVNSNSERNVNSLPLLGLDPATFSTLVYLSDHSAKWGTDSWSLTIAPRQLILDNCSLTNYSSDSCSWDICLLDTCSLTNCSLYNCSLYNCSSESDAYVTLVICELWNQCSTNAPCQTCHEPTTVSKPGTTECSLLWEQISLMCPDSLTA